MKLNSLGLKIALIVSLLISVIIVLVVYIVNSRTTDLVAELTIAKAKTANHALNEALRAKQNEARARAGMIIRSTAVVDAVLNGDGAALKNALDTFRDGLDVIMVCDADGNVILRAHSDSKGDNLMGLKAVSSALATGESVAIIERDGLAGLSTHGSAAIRDYDMLCKRYSALIKQAMDMIPKTASGETHDALIEFNKDATKHDKRGSVAQ